MSLNNKAQVWYIDFLVALFFFLIAYGIFYTYSGNIQVQDEKTIDELVLNANVISDDLMSIGFPYTWNSTSVKRIGILDENYRYSYDKINEFTQVDYDAARILFNTRFNYHILFLNATRGPVGLFGICGIGESIQIPENNVSIAYYYNTENISQNYLVSQFDADVFCPGCLGQELADLLPLVSNYDIIIFEEPSFTNSDFTSSKSDLETYVANGGTILIFGELTINQGTTIYNTSFYKKSGSSISNQTIIVMNSDSLSNLYETETFSVSQARYVEIPEYNSKTIAVFENGQETAIARWSYSKGLVYYFSDMNTTRNLDILTNMNSIIQASAPYTCIEPDFSEYEQRQLIKIDRLALYENTPIVMRLYLWH